MKAFIFVAGFGIALLLALNTLGSAQADHGVVVCGNGGMKACLAKASPFVNQVVKPGGEVTYCINPRGLQYPGFRSQVIDVVGRWALDLRATSREVPYPESVTNSSCLVRNDMRDNHPCGNCGAWVYTQNLPVLIEYNVNTGYSRWDSTIGHEVGHMYCLLDEHYDKVNFRSWILTYGVWQHGSPTVMDVGTWLLSAYAPLGIRYPEAYDLARCVETLGRAVGPIPIDCSGPTDPSWGGTWNPCTGRWVGLDGSQFEPDSGCGNWYDPLGNHMWSTCDPSWGGRYSPYLKVWAQRGSSGFFIPATGYWAGVP